MEKQYVHYGCGLKAPEEWQNFDVSPTLRIQKTPLLSTLLKSQLRTRFPDNVGYGNIIKGLPVKDDSCDGIYCSHVLEHLSLEDFRKALRNTYRILKPGGIFRCVVPDLEYAAVKYIQALKAGYRKASMDFCGPDTLLGTEKRVHGFRGGLESVLGNSRHLWMRDAASLSAELEETGFIHIRLCKFNDSPDPMFKIVEDEGRFMNAVAIECTK